MSLNSMTRLTIMNEGLSQAGRTDLLSNARLWLNLFLEKVYIEQDFDWLKKDSGIVPLVDGGSFPSDYIKFRNARLYDSTGTQMQRELATMSEDEYMALLNQGAAPSTPLRIFLDQQVRQFKFWPSPFGSWNWRYFYKFMPTLPVTTDNSGDGQVPLWYLPNQYLIDAVDAGALYYNHDRQAWKAATDKIVEDIKNGKMNTSDTQGGFPKLKLGKNHRRRW